MTPRQSDFWSWTRRRFVDGRGALGRDCVVATAVGVGTVVSNGHANSSFGHGALRLDPPTGEGCDVFVYDPDNPVPSMRGRSCCDPELAPIGFTDQRRVELRNDVLVYTSGVLDQPLDIRGVVTLSRWIATSAVDTDFTGKLVDVDPEGQG